MCKVNAGENIMQDTHSQDLKVTVEDAVREIVYENSGGLKFSALLSSLLEMIYEYDRISDVPYEKDKISDWLESSIRNMRDIDILDYTWKMDPDHLRAKMFIYQV